MDERASFGLWLKQRRQDLRLTQEDLAERISCSGAMVRKIEAGERAASEQMAELLAEAFGVVPNERPAFVQFAQGRLNRSAIERALWQTMHAAKPHPTNLTAPLTGIIGRRQELERLHNQLLLGSERLFTLTGPPGIGKTRLSLEVGAALLDHFEDGVFFVGLAPVANPDLVAAAIARAIGVMDKSTEPLLCTLQQSLSSKQMMLLLDNFEQVLDASHVVLELLGSCPNLKVLITSREALHVNGEQQYPVPALDNADPGKLPPIQALGSVSSIALFIERARAVKPDFALTEKNAVSVAAICARLDGLPLAIELAAARIRLLSPQEIQARLDSRLPLLTGGPRNLPARQRTLRAAIDWSYNLLNGADQTLFARLSVFVGGCTLGAAEAICNTGGDRLFDVQEGMESLLDKSLLKREEGWEGESRFTMLDTLREYSSERLHFSGEEGEIRALHAQYYLVQAEATAEHARGPDEDNWVGRLETEHDNIRSLLRWLIARGNAEEANRMCGALWVFWSKCSHISEGRAWTEQALELARDRGGIAPKTLAGSLVCAGRMAINQGDYSEARAYQQEAVELYRRVGDRKGESVALNSLALAEHGLLNLEKARILHEQNLALRRALGDKQGMSATLNNLGLLMLDDDPEQGRLLLEESLALSHEMGIQDGVAPTLLNLGIAAYLQSRFADAGALFQRGLALHRQLKNKRGIQIALMRLGVLALEEADTERARDYFSQSLILSKELGNKEVAVWNLEGLASVAIDARMHMRAARLLGASDGLSEAIGAPVYTEPPYHERTLDATQATLDPTHFAAAWASGKAMNFEEAIEYALEEI